MGIISIVTNTAGQGNVNPRRVKIITTDNLATVTAAGYLNQSHNSGYQMFSTDVVDMDYLYDPLTRLGTYAVFTVDVHVGNVTLTELVSGGDVLLPVVSGHAAIFNGSTGQIADAGAAPILSFKAAGQPGQTLDSSTSFPASFTALTVTATQNSSTVTDGDLVGLHGKSTAANVSGGFVYGVKGTVNILSGSTLDSSADVIAIFGQLNIDNVNFTDSSDSVAIFRGDFGSSMIPGTYPGLTGLSITNFTEGVVNSQVELIGAATNLLFLNDNSFIAGPSYFVAAGTAAGSAGDVTKCNAVKVLKIEVNEVDYWIPLFASNS